VANDTSGYAQPTLSDFEKNKKEKPKKRTLQQKKDLHKMLGGIKEKSGCLDCKHFYPFYILDFDHTRGTKVSNVGQMLDYFSVEDIMNEVAKCDVVCSNCHRERTYFRQNKTKNPPQ